MSLATRNVPRLLELRGSACLFVAAYSALLPRTGWEALSRSISPRAELNQVISKHTNATSPKLQMETLSSRSLVTEWMAVPHALRPSPLPGDVNVGSSQQQGNDENWDEDSQCHISSFQRCLCCRFCYWTHKPVKLSGLTPSTRMGTWLPDGHLPSQFCTHSKSWHRRALTVGPPSPERRRGRD